MSKTINKFIDVFRKGNNAVKKLTGSYDPGARIFPSRNSKKDTKYQLRLDAGPMIDSRYREINLQVNSQATSKDLKDWIQKHGTHANLATAEFDTEADDIDKEADRICEQLGKEAKKNL